MPINPSSPGPGLFYLRRKYSKDDYGFYQGKLKEGAYERLTCFKITGSSFKERIALKFYEKKRQGWYKDIQDIYFDEYLVYVPNKKEVFFFRNDNWDRAPALASRPSRLTVITNPAGANVYIEDSLAGKSPVTIGAITENGLRVNVKLPGYYMRGDFADLLSGKHTKIHFNLYRKASDSKEINLDHYTARNTEDLGELENRLKKLNGLYLNQLKINQADLENFEKHYPPLTPQGEFEKTAAYRKRQQKDGEWKAAERQKLMQRGLDAANEISAAHTLVGKFIREEQSKVYVKYFPAREILHVKSFNPDSEFFPVKVTVEEGDFHFNLTGAIFISIEIAPKFKEEMKKGRIKLFYKNKPFKIENEDPPIKRFFGFYEVYLELKGKEYAITGAKFNFSPHLTNHPDWPEAVREMELELAEERIACMAEAREDERKKEIQREREEEHQRQEAELARKHAEEKARLKTERKRLAELETQKQLQAENRARNIKRLRLITRISGGVITTAAAGIAFYYHSQALKKDDEADRSYDEYHSSGTNEDWIAYEAMLDESDSARNRRNALFGIALGGGIIMGVSFAF
ncbi:PEGA domain-containing protein [Fibrobacterota bacterium]